MIESIKFWINDEFYAVGMFSFIGVFIRLSITYSFTFDNAIHDSSASQVVRIFGDQNFLASNILGCFIMSVCLSHMKAINGISGPLYKGLTTGLCGCLTTFSSWMIGATVNTIYQELWIYTLIMVGVEFALTWCGLLLGFTLTPLLVEAKDAWFAKSYDVGLDATTLRQSLMEEGNDLQSLKPEAPLPSTFQKYESYLWPVVFWLPAVILWLCLVFESNIPVLQHPNKKNIFRALAFAPFGVWVRWGLARVANVKAIWPEMNPQTFIANIFAVIVGGSLTICAPHWGWTAAITSGVFGSVSTVSTFFVELHTLNKDRGSYAAFRYGFVTVTTAFLIVQIISAANHSS